MIILKDVTENPNLFFCILGITIAMIGIIYLCVLTYYFVKDKTILRDWFLVFCSIMIVIIGISLAYESGPVKTRFKTYEVKFVDENITIKEITDNYNIIAVDGDIFTIQEKISQDN